LIDFIYGNLNEKKDDYIIIETYGIGYKIHVPMHTYLELPSIGEMVKIYTHFIHKEDAMELYGFLSINEREVFRHLITVSGIGAKLGRKILSDLNYNDVIRAILDRDSDYLTQVSGLGKKSSEKIILELETKFKKFYSYPLKSAKDSINSNERLSIEALLALGYREKEASEAVYTVVRKGKITTTEEIIKSSLKMLAKIT